MTKNPSSQESLLTRWCEAGRIPDSLTRLGIRRLCAQRLREERFGDLEASHQRFRQFLDSLKQSPIAVHTDAANEQHYELPPAFFQKVLGKRLKYSSCFYAQGNESLDQAEDAMLELYAERAQLQNGQDILELGCGWGSLTLWMAQRFPDSRITAVSNSAPQREFITAQARERGLANVEIITCDVNQLQLDGQFDRCISIEMFEHMRNYDSLLARIASWLRPQGRLFVHIFCHRELMYPFETEGDDNWMGRYFFTGGQMPAFDTLLYFQSDLLLEEQWRVSGRHYQQTSNHWLENLDRSRDQLGPVFSEVYGAEQAQLWLQRWRMFFMACAELFGYDNGNQWGVGHYRFVRR